MQVSNLPNLDDRWRKAKPSIDRFHDDLPAEHLASIISDSYFLPYGEVLMRVHESIDTHNIQITKNISRDKYVEQIVNEYIATLAMGEEIAGKARPNSLLKHSKEKITLAFKIFILELKKQNLLTDKIEFDLMLYYGEIDSFVNDDEAKIINKVDKQIIYKEVIEPKEKDIYREFKSKLISNLHERTKLLRELVSTFESYATAKEYKNHDINAAYKTIEKSGIRLYNAWVLNNLIGISSIIIMLYIIWGVWNPNWVIGVIVLLLWSWVINSKVLPYIYGIYNKPIEESAWDAGIFLQNSGKINEEVSVLLTKTKIWKWTAIIKST